MRGYNKFNLKWPLKINYYNQEVTTMSELNTIEMRYFPGEYGITQGHKAGESNHYNKSGKYVQPTGYGWARESMPSQLILYLEKGNETIPVRVDPYFKETVGRMTQKRVNKIIDTMPEKVHVEKQVSFYGNEYLIVKEADLEKWRKKAGLKKKH